MEGNAMVKYDYYTGFPANVLNHLARDVTRIANRSTSIKIGITNEPERRWLQHSQRYPWDQMIVIYGSTSLAFVRDIERELIDYTFDWDESLNFVGGGGGNFAAGYQYVYVLIER